MGQIYLPLVNWVLFFGVVLLVVAFQSSTELAAAYGLSVTGTMLLELSLFLLLANSVLFGSLLFGYAFLWTVAPNWPPPLILQPGPAALTEGLDAICAALA